MNGITATRVWNHYVIYGPGTKDYPGVYVCRRFEIDGGTVTPRELVAKGSSVDELRAEIFRVGQFIGMPERFARHPSDDPNIVETWL